MKGVCLVLGGKGFVGSALAAEATERGYQTLIVDRDEYEQTVGTQCDLLVNANGNSKKFLARENPRLEFDLSVRSVERSLHDFKAARYVHLSTMDIYPDVSDPALNREDIPIEIARQSPYGFHKYLAEQLVRHDAARWTIFRMAGFVGKGLWKNAIYDLLHGQPLRVSPDSEYQYLNTRDLARIVFSVVEQGGEKSVFNITGDGVVSLRSIAAQIPGSTLDPAWDRLPRERYELNLDRLRSLVRIPRTEETIRDFLRQAVSREK
jgi:nucleoside-diphosphate-sugar epimerase